jgi:hypothetical protein
MHTAWQLLPSLPTDWLSGSPALPSVRLCPEPADLVKGRAYSCLPRRSQPALLASSSSQKGLSFRRTRSRYRK